MDLFPNPEILAKEIKTEIKHLPKQNTSAIRSIRLSYSEKVKSANPEYILRLARLLCFKHDLRWVAYEIIADNPAAFRALGAAELEEFGQGINSWWTVDSFARTLSGPAWQYGQISDDIIHQWAMLNRPLVAAGSAGQHSGAKPAVEGRKRRRTPYSGSLSKVG